MIFDDPINSLHYKRMAEVVDRIVALAHVLAVNMARLQALASKRGFAISSVAWSPVEWNHLG